jgi:hypothetical protein
MWLPELTGGAEILSSINGRKNTIYDQGDQCIFPVSQLFIQNDDLLQRVLWQSCKNSIHLKSIPKHNYSQRKQQKGRFNSI